MQWVPGAGEAQEQDWMWLYEQFHRWGKGQILGGNPERCGILRNKFGMERLFLNVHRLPEDAIEVLEAYLAEHVFDRETRQMLEALKGGGE